MKFVDEYRDGAAAEKLFAAIRREAKRPWMLMEVCGGQTHTLIRSGIDRMLPETVRWCTAPAVRSASRRSKRSTARSPSRAAPR